MVKSGANKIHTRKVNNFDSLIGKEHTLLLPNISPKNTKQKLIKIAKKQSTPLTFGMQWWVKIYDLPQEVKIILSYQKGTLLMIFRFLRKWKATLMFHYKDK